MTSITQLDIRQLFVNVAKDNISEIFLLLLNDPRIDPSYKNNAALNFSINNCHTNIAELLLNNKKVILSDLNNAFR